MWHFQVSIATHVRKTNSFITIMQLINPNYPLLKQIVAKVYLLPLLRTTAKNIGWKCSKYYFLEFCYSLSHIWMEMIYWTYFVSVKSSWWPIWTFCPQKLLKRIILKAHSGLAAQSSKFLPLTFWSCIRSCVAHLRANTNSNYITACQLHLQKKICPLNRHHHIKEWCRMFFFLVVPVVS